MARTIKATVSSIIFSPSFRGRRENDEAKDEEKAFLEELFLHFILVRDQPIPIFDVLQVMGLLLQAVLHIREDRSEIGVVKGLLFPEGKVHCRDTDVFQIDVPEIEFFQQRIDFPSALPVPPGRSPSDDFNRPGENPLGIGVGDREAVVDVLDDHDRARAEEFPQNSQDPEGILEMQEDHGNVEGVDPFKVVGGKDAFQFLFEILFLDVALMEKEAVGTVLLVRVIDGLPVKLQTDRDAAFCQFRNLIRQIAVVGTDVQDDDVLPVLDVFRVDFFRDLV